MSILSIALLCILIVGLQSTLILSKDAQRELELKKQADLKVKQAATSVKYGS